MPNPASTLLVIADPKAPFLSGLAKLPSDVRVVVSTDPGELKNRAAEADAILYAYHDGELVSSILPIASRLRWIHSLWTGVEGLMKRELLAHPAPLTNGRGVFRWPLADWAIAAMLFFAFDFRRVLEQQDEQVWRAVHGTSLHGRTLGIVGYGAIGSAAAARAKPFGVKIAAYRRRSELYASDGLVDSSYGPGQLKELMAASDYVLVGLPLTPETRGLVGEAEIAAMKANAVIINVGRGPAIDEAALICALEAGRIRGAALDVFNTEPLPAGHPFWRMKNVLLSPHTADRVDGFLEPAIDCFLQNMDRFHKGEPLRNVVDKHAGY
ncbi:MAG: D-2-hydroxyacid dehydrogenase [Bryobacterales bacterium]|nr:D-2-hydroxyacid dehydrogenase [Bryobacterales bacterium]